MLFTYSHVKYAGSIYRIIGYVWKNLDGILSKFAILEYQGGDITCRADLVTPIDR